MWYPFASTPEQAQNLKEKKGSLSDQATFHVSGFSPPYL